MHFASYYRWMVATRRLKLPQRYQEPLLDIGTDQGHWLSMIEAPICIGVDLQAFRKSKLALVQANALSLPFPGEFFGDVWAFDILEHIEDDKRLVEEALRVLRPGGMLWLSTTSHRFRFFPGGWVQQAFERRWGHVRKGYRAHDLEAMFPHNARAEILCWGEPRFRQFYLVLYLLSKVAPQPIDRLMKSIYAFDTRHRSSDAGHLYARVTKTPPPHRR